MASRTKRDAARSSQAKTKRARDSNSSGGGDAPFIIGDSDPSIDQAAKMRVTDGGGGGGVAAATTTQTAAVPLFGAPPGSSGQSIDDRDPASVLSEPGVARILDVENAVRQHLALLAPDATQGARLIADDISKRKFVVRGLSQRVPNPQRARLDVRRQRLEQQFDYVQRQREEYDRLYVQYGRPAEEMTARIYESELEQRARLEFFQSFRAPQALSLAKPPSAAVGEINEHWLTPLANVLKRLDTAYTRSTPYRTAELVRYHVHPIIEQHAAQLRSSSFEDMPLTAELVRLYFDRYIETAYKRVFEPPSTTDVNAADADIMAALDDSLAGDASSLGHAFRATDQHSAVMLAFYSSVLAVHANRDYKIWLQQWIAKNPDAADDADPDRKARKLVALAAVEEFVAKVIDTAERQAREEQPFSRAVRALSIDEYAAAFARLVRYEVAQHRADNLRSETSLAQEFDDYLQAPALHPKPFPRAILNDMPREVWDDLDAALLRARRRLPDDVNEQARLDARYNAALDAIAEVVPAGRRVYAHSPIDSESAVFAATPALSTVDFSALVVEALKGDDRIDISALPDADVNAIVDARAREADAAANDDADRNAIAERARALKERIEAVWPAALNYAEYRTHVSDRWTPLNLAYLIDRDLTERAKKDISAEISVLWPMFDVEATHAKADLRRLAFDNLYANQRLITELSQVRYLLDHVLSDTVERPLDIERLVYDSSPLVLEARLDLAPELAARIMYVPERDRPKADKQALTALAELDASSFVLEWLKRPHGAADERVIATVTLPAQRTARLDLLGGRHYMHAQPEHLLDVAGDYRARVWQLDARGNRVGQPFESLYTARVRMVAECVRDGARFVPVIGSSGAAQHRECVWQPNPADATHYRDVCALDALVRRGLDEYERIRSPPATFDDLELPPWGASDPEHLMALVQLGEQRIRALFTFEAMIGAFVARFAKRVRARRRQLQLLPSSDLELLGAVVIEEAAQHSAVDALAEIGALPSDLDTRLRPTQKGSGDADIETVGRAQTNARALTNSEPQLQIGHFLRSVRDVPLPSLMAALRHPLVVEYQTGRERRFFRKVAVECAALADMYRTGVAANERIPIHPTQPGYSTALTARFDAQINAELGEMGADATLNGVVRYYPAIADGTFYDTDSDAEFRCLILNMPTYGSPDTPTPPNHEGFWFAAHSFETNQPQLAALTKSAATFVSADGVEFAASIALKRRGSEPIGRGYDYHGLHQTLEQRVRAYNEAAAGRARASSQELQTAMNDAGRAVTVYNYFAFLAPTLPAGNFITAGDIERRLLNDYYADVRFPPTPFERTSNY